MQPARATLLYRMKAKRNFHAQITGITALARQRDNEAFEMTKVPKNAVHFYFVHQAGIGPSLG